MSGHCHGCGTYHEEDDDRLCAKCAADVIPATKRFPEPENDAIQRYDVTSDMAMPRDGGRWVKYEDHIAEVERLSAMVYDTAPGEFSPDGWTWKQAFTAEKARRIEAEAAIETLHEKYAQERIFRSRQTLSDNTKMENQ